MSVSSVTREPRLHVCDEPGPYEAHCSQPPMHDYSCYDGSKDVSFNGRQDWEHKHPGCSDDGLVSEER